MPALPDIRIPADLLPADGRFGCGPSKVRPEAVAALAAAGAAYLGTSHRQARVQFDGRRACATAWPSCSPCPTATRCCSATAAPPRSGTPPTFGLIERRSQHLRFGEFSSKFADGGRGGALPRRARRHRRPTPAPTRCPVADRRRRRLRPHPQRDLDRRGHAARAARRAPTTALVLVDATSAAGGLRFDPAEIDVYYFAPQKCLASDGGLWLAACSPAAIERIERIAAVGPLGPGVARPRHRPRELPQGPDLQHAGAGHDLPGRPAGRVDQPERRPRVGRRPLRRARPRSSTAGPRRRATPRRS